MADVATMARPQRWDSPFDPAMDGAVLAMLLARPEFSCIDAGRFPSSMSLEAILRNDCRVIKYKAGEIVIREGDYGNSAFLNLKGSLKAVFSPGLPQEVLGRTEPKRPGIWNTLAQLWSSHEAPEVRDTSRYVERVEIIPVEDTENRFSLLDSEPARHIFRDGTPISKAYERSPNLGRSINQLFSMLARSLAKLRLSVAYRERQQFSLKATRRFWKFAGKD